MANFEIDSAAIENIRRIVEGGRHVVVVDLDGTLSIVNPDRMRLIPPFEKQGCTKAWEPFNLASIDDAPKWELVRLVRTFYANGWTVIVATVRGGSARGVIERWLHKHAVPHHALLMRGMNDLRPSKDVKREMFRLIGTHRINLVIDDDDAVISAAESEGLCVLKAV